MSRLTPNTRCAGLPYGHPIRPVTAILSALLLTLAAGCAQLQLPPPDARAARLPETQDITAMTDAQQQALTRLNERIYNEQETTIERERAQRAIADAMRNYSNNAYFYSGWGSPGWYGPGYGSGWYGPGGYGPRTSVGIGIGF